MKTITRSARLSMKTKTNTLLGAVLFLLVIGATAPASAQVWQASTDYSATQGYRNWRYMSYVTDGDGGGTYEPMVYGETLYGFVSWHHDPDYGEFIEGDFMHPSDVEPARVWESPVAGSVRVTGTVAKEDPNGGDGVYATIWKNGLLLWDATIAYDDLVGSSFDLPVDVNPGDWLIFRVNRIGNQNYDSTIFDPRIVESGCAAQVQAPINADGTSIFNGRRGVVPVRFRLVCDGNPTCDLQPATIAVTRTAGGVIGGVNESVYSSQADSGPNFRALECQYHYNLDSRALGVGTYRVDILIDGQVEGSATFQLE